MTTTLLPTSRDFALSVPGFTFHDLFEPRRLRALDETFLRRLAQEESALAAEFLAYRAGAELSPVAESDLLVRVAPHVGRFMAHLFRSEEGHRRLLSRASDEQALARLKALVKKAARAPKTDPVAALADGQRFLDDLRLALPVTAEPRDQELDAARTVGLVVELEEAVVAARRPANAIPLTDAARQSLAMLRAGLLTAGQALHAIGIVPDDAAMLAALSARLVGWARSCLHTPEGKAATAGWVSFHLPHAVHFDKLVASITPDPSFANQLFGPVESLRRRDGFELTDRRMDTRQVAAEVDYCLLCHDRDKDSCCKGLKEPTGAFKKNKLGIELSGCPLDEKISEAHMVRRSGDSIGALAVVMIDNPMCPGTGHRICNDCMKACIFQAQDPVNIPQAETGILTDVLRLDYGVEIYGLLTRWNPLNRRRPHALPYVGRKVLVVGMGPAGYTLAHYLMNEGFGVTAIDGLKIEPPPADLLGSDGHGPRGIKHYSEIEQELDERTLAGFGGVSEYGITVRWDKNFLYLLQITLMRRNLLDLHGGTRFGGTVTIEDAWRLGFDHIAIATGAGKPTIVNIKNNLCRGIRKASDFLMALQLTGASKKDNLSNLQVRLPALVVGGGLTAIDTATELFAYYPVQVEKHMQRHEQLCAELGKDKVEQFLSAEDKEILAEFQAHYQQIKAERARAARVGEAPDFVPLVRSWGGVSLAYRKGMKDSPAYRLNHEEIIKALEEGIGFIENLSPLEAITDSHGALKEMVFAVQGLKPDGRFGDTGLRRALPCRALMVAAGTSPNTIYERERPGTFKLDQNGEFFAPHLAQRRADGSVTLLPVQGPTEGGFFTSYHDAQGRTISYFGDNHPVYEGNVVKAMASARDGHPHIVSLFAHEVAAMDHRDDAQDHRDAEWRSHVSRVHSELHATIKEVVRLTPTIVEVIVRAPAAARHFEPGQFYRLQNYETLAPVVDGTRLAVEGLALTGAWVDKPKGLLSVIVLEMGGSSRLCAAFKPGEPVVMMGPTGTPTEIPHGETVCLFGGGLGNAVLFSIAAAMKKAGNKVLYFAGYKKPQDLYKQDEVERSTDEVIWSVDVAPAIQPRRPQDKSFVGNIVQSFVAYASGQLGPKPFDTRAIDRIIAIGSDRMMAAVKEARHGVMKPFLKEGHVALGSINSTMQCMMKEICAQCLQRHVDPVTGKESFVFSCFNQDQHLDEVDWSHLNSRLRQGSLQEKLTNLWLDHLLKHPDARDIARV